MRDCATERLITALGFGAYFPYSVPGLYAGRRARRRADLPSAPC
ncbi:hypothetical protein [Nonomuraea sp. NPDC049480]